MFKFNLPLFFDTASDKGGAPTVSVPSDDIKDDISLLGTEDDDKDKPASTEDEDENKDDVDADDTSVDDEENPDEDAEGEEDGEEELDKDGNKKKKVSKGEGEESEEEDLVRHSYSAIKKEYPDLFKKFPGLKQAFFREQEFTKIFPSVDDAKFALAAQENFEGVREAVFTGNAEEFLNQVKAAMPDAVEKFASNFLGDLRKVDKDVYIEVTTPVIRGVLQQALAEAIDEKDENIIAACKVIHKAIFGGGYEDISRRENNGRERTTEKNPEQEKFNKEKNDFYQQKYDALRVNIWSEVESSLTREIEKGLDPTNSIRPGLKKILVERIFDEVTKKVATDSAHVNRMSELWNREKKAGYNGTLKDSIRTTYLSRAKALMPAIRARIRTEAVEQQKSGDSDKRERVSNNNKRKDVPAGREGGNNKKVVTAKEANKSRMSDMDILNS